MAFYTETFNGRDESADNPPNQWDRLKDVPYAPDLRNPDTQADFGIPSDAEAARDRATRELHTLPDLRDPDTMADFGIPSDAEAARDRATRELHTLPNLRDPDTMADFGIPSDAEAARDREIRAANAKERKIREDSVESLSERLGAIETNYVDNRADLPGRKTPERHEPISRLSARERIFDSSDAKELEACLDALQNDPYAIGDLLSQGFGIANEIRSTSYGYSPKNLSEEQTKQLKNFISFFASVVERGMRIPSEYSKDGVTLSEKSNSLAAIGHVVPLEVAIDAVADMIEEKGTGDTSVDNPINELTGANGKEKIGVRELADLAAKAYSTKTKRPPFTRRLSDDTINFPAPSA